MADTLHQDRSGLPLTTCSAEAAGLYRQAIERIHAGQAGPPELLDQAIAADPAFALAHAARWMEAHGAGDEERAKRARVGALASCEGATPWEQGHVACVAAMLGRDPGAADQVRAHLSARPGDLLLATLLIGDLFFNGGEAKREAVMEVLRSIEAHNADDWAFAARLGFHTSELGDPRAALAILAPALEARPDAPFVAHATAHALLESGERDASYLFLRDWAAEHDPAGPLDGHIHWHLSLGELERGEAPAAIERYRRSSAPGKSHCALGLLLADAGGLFGRMTLDGTATEGMPRAELEALLGKLGGALRIPFVAVHAAALSVALGDVEALRCIEDKERAAQSGEDDAELRVVAAFRSYAEGDMRGCLAALERDRLSAWAAIGGSNEERALIAKLHARAYSQISAS